MAKFGEGREWCKGAPMLTVGKDAAHVERLLEDGFLVCPCCGGSLGPWGYAPERRVAGEDRRLRRVRPRRSRCKVCGGTRVLLPADLLVRRGDDVSVIGRVLADAARGHGHRRIAAALGRSEDTVRDWLRRFRGLAVRVREGFTRLGYVLAPDPVPLEPAGSPLADAVVAVAAAADAAWSRWPAMRTLSAWEVAAAVTSGSLMSPAVMFSGSGDGSFAVALI